jgi:spore maturation protein CgeB
MDDAGLANNGLRRRALERLGCAVATLDPSRTGWLERLVNRDLEARLRTALAQHTPEIVVVAGTGVVPVDLVESLRGDRGRCWAQLLGDEVPEVDQARREVMAYNHVFLGSRGGVALLEQAGVKHASYLALGCDPSVHKPLGARGQFRANVVFAGGATARRERYLAGLVEFGLALWGPGWRRTTLKDYCRGELPNTDDYVKAYAGATVAVNVHRLGPGEKRLDTGGLNQRAFELAAIGTAQVVDTRPDLSLHFEDGAEILAYSAPEELKGQVKRALHDDKYRDRLAAAARQRAISQHTYMHRMHGMLRTLRETKA